MSRHPEFPPEYPNWFRNRLTALPPVRRLALRTKLRLKKDFDRFLGELSGVIHVGGNVAQERFLYDAYRLDVLWIEPDPNAFAILQRNLVAFPRQRAMPRLITDRDGEERPFFIANCGGTASSIFERKLHRELFPQIEFTKTITLRTTTLPTLLADEQLDPRRYNGLVLDVQGAELLVLQGAEPLLANFKYIKTEAADIEAYQGNCLRHDLERYLVEHGFERIAHKNLTQRPTGGGLYDLVFRRRP